MKIKYPTILSIVGLLCLCPAVDATWNKTLVADHTDGGSSHGGDIAWAWMRGVGGAVAAAVIDNATNTSSMSWSQTAGVNVTVQYTSSTTPPEDCPYFLLKVNGTCLGSGGAPSSAGSTTKKTEDRALGYEVTDLDVSASEFDLSEDGTEAKSERLANLKAQADDGKNVSLGGNLSFNAISKEWSGSLIGQLLFTHKNNPDSASGLEGAASGSTIINITSPFNMASLKKEERPPVLLCNVFAQATVEISGRATSGGEVHAGVKSDAYISKLDIEKYGGDD